MLNLWTVRHETTPGTLQSADGSVAAQGNPENGDNREYSARVGSGSGSGSELVHRAHTSVSAGVTLSTGTGTYRGLLRPGKGRTPLLLQSSRVAHIDVRPSASMHMTLPVLQPIVPTRPLPALGSPPSSRLRLARVEASTSGPSVGSTPTGDSQSSRRLLPSLGSQLSVRSASDISVRSSSSGKDPIFASAQALRNAQRFDLEERACAEDESTRRHARRTSVTKSVSMAASSVAIDSCDQDEWSPHALSPSRRSALGLPDASSQPKSQPTSPPHRKMSSSSTSLPGMIEEHSVTSASSTALESVLAPLT